MKSHILAFAMILLCLNAGADKETLKSDLYKASTKKPLINEVVDFRPIPNHHFNLEAPNECGAKSTMNPTASKISCQFHNEGSRRVTLSVCDDKKTYCKQERFQVSVRPKKSGSLRMEQPPALETLKMQRATKSKLMKGFKSMTISEARQAVTTKKGALVMVSADWCPPCNHAKEFLLPSEDFKDQSKGLLKVYVDGDSPLSEGWKEKLSINFYPTFIFLNKGLEPVSYFTDIEQEAFSKQLARALKHRDDPITLLEKRITRRESGSYLRWFKDFFWSDEEILVDQRRYLDNLMAQGEFEKVLVYAKENTPEDELQELKLEAKTRADLSELSLYKDLSEKEVQKKETQILWAYAQLLKEKGKDYFMPLYLFCKKTSTEKGKKLSDRCLSGIADYEGLSKERVTELSEVERALHKANRYFNKGMLFTLLNEDEKAQEFYDTCVKEYENLYAFSPLKEKSRSVRMKQLYCMKNTKGSINSQQVALLESLREDYPFEETFHRKLASYYQKEEKYQKALEANTAALKYSYGRMWVYNANERAKILKKLDKNKQALAFLEESLQEISLRKEEDGATRLLSSMREQYNELKKAKL